MIIQQALLVERWFGLLTQQAIRRASFNRVAQLERALARFLDIWNQTARPFTWTKTAHRVKRSMLNLFPKRDTSSAESAAAWLWDASDCAS